MGTLHSGNVCSLRTPAGSPLHRSPLTPWVDLTHTADWEFLTLADYWLGNTSDTPYDKKKQPCLEYMDCHPIKRAVGSCSVSPDGSLSSVAIDPKASSRILQFVLDLLVCIFWPTILAPVEGEAWKMTFWKAAGCFYDLLELWKLISSLLFLNYYSRGAQCF